MGQRFELASQHAAALSTDYVAMFIQFVAEKGVAATDMLVHTDIEAGAIGRTPYITFRQLTQLLHNASQLLDDPTWGLAFGSRLHVGSHGLLGHISTSATDALHSLQHVQKFLPIRNQLVTIQYEMTPNGVTVTFDLHPHVSHLQRPIVDGCLSGLLTVLSTKLRFALDDIEVQVRYPPPADTTALHATLGKNLHFASATNSITLPLALLMQHNTSANSGVFQLVTQQSEAALSHIHQQDDLPQTIERYLLENPECLMSQHEMAKKLHMTPRTLRRHLLQAGLRYQEIQNTVKKNTAVRYLEHTTWSIEEIADRLGYSEEVNFSRAFKRWVGITPSLFRQQCQHLS